MSLRDVFDVYKCSLNGLSILLAIGVNVMFGVF